MTNLRSMPNIGKVLEEKLIEIGISSSEELMAVGSREAFAQIRDKDSTACLSKLCALEGAVRGVRWHDLEDEVKKELNELYTSLHKF